MGCVRTGAKGFSGGGAPEKGRGDQQVLGVFDRKGPPPPQPTAARPWGQEGDFLGRRQSTGVGTGLTPTPTPVSRGVGSGPKQ